MFTNEKGHGLGPTLEFYNLLAKGLQEVKFNIGPNNTMVTLWRDNVPNCELFPRAINSGSVENETIKKICKLFQIAGTFMAKCILDERLMDMPISPLMWDIILGKKLNVFSLKSIDKNLYRYLAGFQIIANRKVELEEDMTIDETTRE